MPSMIVIVPSDLGDMTQRSLNIESGMHIKMEND